MRRYDVVMLVFYGFLALVLTLPLPYMIDKVLIGHDVDVLINPWANWWMKKALSEGLDLYHTDYLFFPQGTSLVFHSFSYTNTAVSLILEPLLGPVVAYNIPIFLVYVLSGFSMYLLASHLTGCRPAAFISGLVFAFHPYHMFESGHPNLVTTQWIPLFVLALSRMLHETGSRRVKQMLLAVLWFLLTALSGWHLMTLLAAWTGLYLLYGLFFERAEWSAGSICSLGLLIALIASVIVPFLWPILRAQLTTDTAYVAVDVETGLGNDLLSFFLPNERHPLFGGFFSGIHAQFGYIRRWRSAYLGYTALGLAAAGLAKAWRKSRPWLLTGSLFFLLSLGSRIEVGGVPLHDFRLPWAIPIINVVRHPYRLNIFLFFSLAVLVGFGGRWLYGRVTLWGQPWGHRVLALVFGVLLVEYLVFPFPVTLPSYSPFLYQMAQEEGDFAVADFPMGRQAAKYYMLSQTIHGHKIVDGHVSRTPDDVYAFVDADPLLGPLRANAALHSDVDIEEQFAVLAAQGIRYIIVHKHLLTIDEMTYWQEQLADFPTPVYEDELLIVYRTMAP
ncbi:MAG: hypothetical protein JXA14_00095 [Anaerolineae bacterium]|nr:hypothetical protein [Anaerolineae bacterium]